MQKKTTIRKTQKLKKTNISIFYKSKVVLQCILEDRNTRITLDKVT